MPTPEAGAWRPNLFKLPAFFWAGHTALEIARSKVPEYLDFQESCFCSRYTSWLELMSLDASPEEMQCSENRITSVKAGALQSGDMFHQL